MPHSTTNIFIAGVGGQGIILASEVLSDAALARKLDVKKSEIHGMAQRGGAVVSHVRFGEKVYSPVIGVGDADVMLSFEKMEALRWIHYVTPGGKVIVNDQQIIPSGLSEYPSGLTERIRERFPEALLVGGLDLAKEAGSVRSVNIVLLGALSNYLDFTDDEWSKAITARVPKKTIDVNLAAFELGRKAAA